MMADRRRRSPEGSSRRRKEPARSEYDEGTRMRSRNHSASLSSSSSSSYIDISRTFPRNRIGGAIRTFFTAPSERRRARRRRSSRLLALSNSSSSSVNSDLAYGTGFIRKPKLRRVRSRTGKEIDRERDWERNRERERLGVDRRATTDAEIIAVGAGLRELARKQNKLDIKAARDGKKPEGFGARETRYGADLDTSRGLAPSKVSYGSDTFDEDGWESASDGESEFSVDSKLAYGSVVQSSTWSSGDRRPQRSNSVVDPSLFGPQNSLHGYVTEPVGFGEVELDKHSDFGQPSRFSPPRPESIASGSQASLQHVYPIPTGDPSRFDAARGSVVSARPEPYVSSRPGPIPIQQPQPITPVSQSVFEPAYVTPSDSGKLKKTPLSSSRGKSLAEAALVGVAGAAIGAAITSERNSKRREEDQTSLKRRDSDRNESKEERRREKRDSSDREERREKRRDREREKEDDSRRERKREKRRDELREETREERRERRREEKRNERSDDRHSKSDVSSSISKAIDPFKYQVADDAFPTPDFGPVTESSAHRRIESGPTVVTVEREPDFTRKRSSSIKDRPIISQSDPGKGYADRDDRDQRYPGSDIRDERRALRDAESIYQETEHTTAPIEVGAIGAAVAAIAVEGYRESRSERRRGERRGDYDDYDSKSRNREPKRDPIQEDADRAYREIVMARKIASNVIRSRTPSPDRSVVNKYDEKEEEEEIIRIVTPPGMEDHKKKGPYDAPNADVQLDHVLDPKDLESFRSPILGRTNSDPYFSRDVQAPKARPLLNLVRPTPTPSPLPEKQVARSESAQSKKSKPEREVSQSEVGQSKPEKYVSRSEVGQSTQQKPEKYVSRSEVGQSRDRGRSTAASEPEIIIGSRGTIMPSPTASTVSKGVTWGENETKHYEVESPSTSPVRNRERFDDQRTSSGSKSKGWGAIAAGIMGVGAGAAIANSGGASTDSKSKDNGNDRNQNEQVGPYEYRGVVVEPGSPPRSQCHRSPPAIDPKLVSGQGSHIPGAFDDDLDFTATLAAGLEDTGFDPNIVIDDPTYRRRSSPPESNELGVYRAPFAEAVTDLGTMDSPRHEGASPVQGSIMGEVPNTPKGERSTSIEETPTKLSKKEQKKLEKAAKRQSSDVTPLEENPATREIVEEPETYFDTPKLSKKEKKKRDKTAQRQNSLAEETTPYDESSTTRSIVEEPESYFETPKKSKKSKKSSSGFDDDMEQSRDGQSTVSVPVDAYEDIQNDDYSVETPANDEWDTPKKSKKKSKRDSDRFDSPSRSGPSSEIGSEVGRSSSSKKSKDKSRRKSEHDEPDIDPTEVPLPMITPSETGRDDYSESRKTRRSSTKDSDIFDSTYRGDSQSVVSAGASRYDDDEPRKSKKKSRSGRDDNDDTKSIASAPAGDDWEDSKKNKKKDKRSSGSFFGLFGSKSEPDTKDVVVYKDEWEEPKKKSKKSKRSSTTDLTSESYIGNGHSNGNGSHYHNGDEGGGSQSDNDKRKKENESFLVRAGTLGAGVGLAGTAVAIATQHRQSKATNVNRVETLEQQLSHSDIPLQEVVKNLASSCPAQEVLDPEIMQRQFRPSIDPQYGDLLPLPPSGPPSPDVEPTTNLPELPESRPTTPEAERRSTRDKSSARKSWQETPMKSPSHSAVPLKFIMGNRPTPSSPVVVRSSPTTFSATTNPENLASPRTRPRPTSWDSTKEYKPLYLVESNRRSSFVQQPDSEEVLPALPPSGKTSRSSSQLELDDLAKGQEMLDHPLNEEVRSLSIDTSLPSTKGPSGFLDSGQSTPKANRTHAQAFDEALKTERRETSSLPDLPSSRKASPIPREHEKSLEDNISTAVNDVALVSSIGYFASAHTSRPTNKFWLDELPSKSPGDEQEPSPVQSMSKDRSSYLLHSTPPPMRFRDADSMKDEAEIFRDIHEKSLDAEALPDILAKEGGDIVGPSKDTIVDAIQDQLLDDHSTTGEQHDLLPEKTKPNLADNNADSTPRVHESRPQEAPKVVDMSESILVIPEAGIKPASTSADKVDQIREEGEDFSFTKSKKDKKKDKKNRKGLSRSSTQDDMSVGESSRDIPEEDPVADDFTTAKSKKDKKKKDKSTLDWEPEIDPENKSEPRVMPEELDDFVTSGLKKSKKKKGKATLDWEPEPPPAIIAAPEPEPELEKESEPKVISQELEEFMTSGSQKSKKKKGRSTLDWEPEAEEEGPGAQVLSEPPESVSKSEREKELEPQIVSEEVAEFSMPGSKKSKKKKAKSTFDWEPEPEPVPAPAAPLVSEDAEEFSTPGSKKGKKNSKKIQAWDPTDNLAAESFPEVTDLTALEESIETTNPTQPEETAEFVMPGAKKGKKKSKKSQMWEPEEEVLPLESTNETVKTPSAEAQQPETSDEFVTPGSKKGKKKSKKSQQRTVDDECSEVPPIPVAEHIPESYQEATPEASLKPTPKTLPEDHSETIREINTEPLPETVPETLPESHSEVVRDIVTEPHKETIAEYVQHSHIEVTPETVADTHPEMIAESLTDPIVHPIAEPATFSMPEGEADSSHCQYLDGKEEPIMPGSKKSKVKYKKSQSWTPDDADTPDVTQEVIPDTTATELSQDLDRSSPREEVVKSANNTEEFVMPGSEKGKKKSKKTQAWVPNIDVTAEAEVVDSPLREKGAMAQSEPRVVGPAETEDLAMFGLSKKGKMKSKKAQAWDDDEGIDSTPKEEEILAKTESLQTEQEENFTIPQLKKGKKSKKSQGLTSEEEITPAAALESAAYDSSLVTDTPETLNNAKFEDISAPQSKKDQSSAPLKDEETVVPEQLPLETNAKELEVPVEQSVEVDPEPGQPALLKSKKSKKKSNSSIPWEEDTLTSVQSSDDKTPEDVDISEAPSTVESDQYSVSKSKKSKKKSKKGQSWEGENASTSEQSSSERNNEALEISEAPPEVEPEQFSLSRPKKSNKKSRLSQTWTSDDVEAPEQMLTEKGVEGPENSSQSAGVEPELFVGKGSKKSKKRTKTFQSGEDVGALVPEQTNTSQQPTDIEPDEWGMPRSMKSKKKSKAQVLEPETEPEPTWDDIETMTSGVSKPLETDDLAIPSSKKAVEPALDSALQGLPEPEGNVAGPVSPASKPTPIGGPGAWPITPATPLVHAGEEQEGHTAEYFPSASTLHHQLIQQSPDDAQGKGYSPSATTILPVAAIATAVFGENILKEGSPDTEGIEMKDEVALPKSVEAVSQEPPQMETEPDRPAIDGLTAGYKEEQLRLAKQMQEEFSTGSKKSKKDKKKRQSSLPPTSGIDDSRSRQKDNLVDVHSRARSLSKDPRASSQNPEEPPTTDERKSLYSEEQLELARQLKAEQESGGKKSKKDKKKRQSLSHSSTQNDSAFDSFTENDNVEPAAPAANAENTLTPYFVEDAPKPDGFAAGYQEDQLSLARQLQAEFGSGSKKSKKDKKRGSTLQAPVDEQEPSESYFEEPQKSQCESSELAAQSAIEKKTSDGLAAGYNEDQLELARQLKEEFESGSKKSKKDKKRQSLVRSATGYDSSSDAPAREPDNPSEPANLPSDIVEGQTELITAVPQDESTFATKKTKKSKKRQSLLRTAMEESFSLDNIAKDSEDAPSVESGEASNEAVTADPENDFILPAKMSKKDKKRQGLLRGSTEIEISGDFAKGAQVPELTEEPSQNTLATEDDFAFVGKKSEKENKRQSILRSATEDGTSDNLTKDVKQVEEVVEGPSVPTPPTEDDFTVTGKKSKKGKKRQSLLRTATKDDIPSESPAKDLDQLSDAVALPELDVGLSEGIPAVPDDEFAFVPKVSKKDKKKQTGLAFQDDAPDEPATDTSPAQSSTLEASAMEATKEPESVDDFGLTSKKSKKDKKKRQNLLQSAATDEPTNIVSERLFAEPESIELTNANEDQDPETSAKQDRAYDDIEITDTVADSSESPYSSLNIKKPKKDKKKRKDLWMNEPIEASRVSATSEPSPEPLEEADQSSSSPSKKSSKDKRKREKAADVIPADVPTASEAAMTSWADEVEAADAEKGLSTDGDTIGNPIPNQTSTRSADPLADDFFRPTKKGKKTKKKNGNAASSEPVATAGILAMPTETESSKGVDDISLANQIVEASMNEPPRKSIEPKEEHSNRTILAAVDGALAATALQHAKDDVDKSSIIEFSSESKMASKDTDSPATKKLSKKEKRKRAIDKRTVREDDMFDDPILWEGAEPRAHEEVEDVDDGSDGFWSAPNVEGPAPEMKLAVESLSLSENPAISQPKMASSKPIAKDTSLDTPEQITLVPATPPEEATEGVERDIAETRADHELTSTSKKDPLSEAQAELPHQDLPKPEQQWNDLPGEFIISSKRDKKQNLLAAWVTPAEPEKPTEAVAFTNQNQFSSHPRVSVEESNTDKSISLDELPVEQTPVSSLSSNIFRRSGSLGLPVLKEEVEIENRHDESSYGPSDVNRDSAFVTDSPIPAQRGFSNDHEHIRDSGVHLRDYSPAGQGRPLASADDALERLSWPSVNEDTETVDLNRSQRPKGLKEVERHGEGGADLKDHLQKPKADHGSKHQAKDTEIDRLQKSKAEKYGDIRSAKPLAEKIRLFNDNAIAAGTVAAGISAARSHQSREQHWHSGIQSQRSSSNINRLRSPDPKIVRPDSVGSNRSTASGTPPLRRSDRKLSGDLRSLSQRSTSNLDLAKGAELAAIAAATSATSNVTANAPPANPTANEGRVRAKDMADVYDGFGEGRMGSPRSPTRPHSMRRRQSMQVLDLEQRLEQLTAENRVLAEAKAQAEHTLQTTQHAASALADRDAEIDSLKQSLDWLHREVNRLTEVNDGLTSANITLGHQHNDRYSQLEAQHAQATRELHDVRVSHDSLSAGMEGIVQNEVQKTMREKDVEIAQLRSELEAAKEQIRAMQREILASKANDSEFLTIRDEDYFDNSCQALCQHVQQWVLRFSKFSDMRACRLTSEINNDKIIDRLDNAILDGSDVDSYLADRIKRRDVFMSMTMTMVWEFVFTRYLFGMDREQRQKLKSLEKLLSEVGPPAAVHQWRATTLTLLAKREAFLHQREQDTEAVVHEILNTLFEILPPPSQLEDQIGDQLRRVMKAAVDLSIEMRTQRAEYMMLPPLQPEYDANGDLASKVSFNAALMNERSGDTVSNEELEAQKAVVRVVLFPLVVKKGDDKGEGDEEIVVCPAQVLVARPKKTVRVFSPGSIDNRSHISMQSTMPAAEYGQGIEGSI